MKVQLNDIRAKKTWTGVEPKNHSPSFDYCRKLIAEGVDPTESLEVYRGEELAYTVASIGEGAKWKIRENEDVGPKYVKYLPTTWFKQAQKLITERSPVRLNRCPATRVAQTW